MLSILTILDYAVWLRVNQVIPNINDPQMKRCQINHLNWGMLVSRIFHIDLQPCFLALLKQISTLIHM